MEMESTDSSKPSFDYLRVIEELVLNSIDASSTCIAIRVNWETFCFQVIDNGKGIDKSEMDLQPSGCLFVPCKNMSKEIYGHHGQAISQIIQLSTSLEIVSQLEGCEETFQKIYNTQSSVLSKVEKAETRRPSCGTTVTVINYLSMFPEIRASFDQDLMMKKLQRLIKSLALIHCKISFSVRDDTREPPFIFQTKKKRDTVEAARFLLRLEKHRKMLPFHRTSQRFKIKGLIGKQRFKSLRLFVFVNNRVVDSVKIGDFVSSILGNPVGVFTYSAIILNIKCSRSEFNLEFEWEKREVNFVHWDELLLLIEKVLNPFSSQEIPLDLHRLDTVVKTEWITSWLNTQVSDNSQDVEGISSNKAGNFTQVKNRNVHELSINSRSTPIRNEVAGCLMDICDEQPIAINQIVAKAMVDNDLPMKKVVSPFPSPYGKITYSNIKWDEMQQKDCEEIAKTYNPSKEDVMTPIEQLVCQWIEEDEFPHFGSFPTASMGRDVNSGMFMEHNSQLLHPSNKNEDEEMEHASSAKIILDKRRPCDDGGSSVLSKIPKMEDTVMLEDWIQIEGSNGTYYFHTPSGNTSYTFPKLSETLYELREKFSSNVNFNELNIPNEFWIQRKQPMNVANSSHHSLPFYRAAPLRRCTFSKSVFGKMQVIKQVDRKFICCLAEENGNQHLLLIDQHAAHERVCLEKLFLIHSNSDPNGLIQIKSSPLHPHLELSFSDIETLQKLSGEFVRYGLQLRIDYAMNKISVTHVPTCFLSRETNETRRKRTSVYKELVETLIQDTVSEFTLNGTLSASLMPPSIRNVLNSLACHGAIRFGDELTQNQSIQLIRALGACDMPFQCAHGRPLIAPLLKLDDLVPLTDNQIKRPLYARLNSISFQ